MGVGLDWYRPPLSFGHFPLVSYVFGRGQPAGPSTPCIPCESRCALSRPLTLHEGDGAASHGRTEGSDLPALRVFHYHF